MKINIRLIYLYLFSFVGLIVFVIGCIRLVDLGLKVYVFKNADTYTFQKMPSYPDDKRTPAQIEQENIAQEKFQKEESVRNRQREVSGALAMMIIGGPLYLYHWKTIQRENKQSPKKRS
jgi:hypothetical protein